LHLSVHSYVMMNDDPKRHNILRSKKQKKKGRYNLLPQQKVVVPLNTKPKHEVKTHILLVSTDLYIWELAS
jgi:hypothetical protein